MNQWLAVALLVLCVALACSCSRQPPAAKPAELKPQTESPKGPAGFPPPVMNQPYPGTGVVAQINRAEGWIEINHEEIKGLMPAMQMEFNVKDKSLLDRVKAGDRVEFTIVETEKGEYLTNMKRAKPLPQ